MLPEFLGGSADLTGSNLTNWKGCCQSVGKGWWGNYIHYGVREFGMVAIMNGIALHGGHLPFGGTFLVFSDYARNGLRLAALMGLREIFVLTHDSIGLGEDGPTHQPVEHAASLRLIPGLDVWRPCDALETAIAWRSAVERKGPSCLLLSRQGLPEQPGGAARIAGIAKGGYVLAEMATGEPDIVLIATGSEVILAAQAAARLSDLGIKARIVSMPSTTVFDRQDRAYRSSILPDGVRRVAVEAGVTAGWWKYVGLDGAVVGVDRFGESGPGDAVFAHLGVTVDMIVETARAVLDGAAS
jgi:transketolase